jgi:hypothetical protein
MKNLRAVREHLQVLHASCCHGQGLGQTNAGAAAAAAVVGMHLHTNAAF